MKFYDREKEIAQLRQWEELSLEYAQMTVVVGRRRIGKTTLIKKAMEGRMTLYFFVAKKNETLLCEEFVELIRVVLNVKIVGQLTDFKSIFEYLMQLSTERHFTLIIDEFQEFFNINSSVYSDMQNIWDQYRKSSHMNLIVSGSIYSLMQKIFQDNKEPLFGRADNIIKLSAFSLSVLKEIMHEYAPTHSNDDLLALYTFTGGVPKFTEEGKNLLIEEFGKNYGTYFSILSAIAGGRNTQAEIEAALGEKSAGGYLKRLIDDYNIIIRQRPILAKESSTTVRYEICDNFIRFWFNYFDRNRSLIEIKNFVGLRNIIKADYPTYSGKILELYFKQKFAESYQFRAIGSWWENKGNQNEIDIVALGLEKNKAVVAEVKRQRKNFKPELLEQKVEHLKKKLLPRYTIETMCLSLEDM